jgi:hypothetical protein
MANAYLYLLLMRHGAGIKAGQDPEKTPPGPDKILTVEGFRNAEAVGQQLAETLATSPDGPVTVRQIWYATKAIPGESEATAKVVATQLTPAGVYAKAKVPQACPQIGPEEFPASSRDAATKAYKVAKDLNNNAEKEPGKAILVVGNSPQVDWIAEQLLGRPIAIGRGEVVCLSRPLKRWRRLIRQPRMPLWDLRWTVGPSEETTIKDLREKIGSKMDVAKFLGTFITALVTFVLGKRFDALKAAGANPAQPIPPVQTWLWWITIALLATAALLCFAALFYYDTLLMPNRYWTSHARRLRLRRLSRWPRGRWLVERPPSSAAWVLQQNMMRVWNRLVVPAICTLGLALSVFALLVLANPRTGRDLMQLEPFVVLALAVALVGAYLRLSRPRLGVQD